MRDHCITQVSVVCAGGKQQNPSGSLATVCHDALKNRRCQCNCVSLIECGQSAARHNEYFFHEWARERRGYSSNEMSMCSEVTVEKDSVKPCYSTHDSSKCEASITLTTRVISWKCAEKVF